MTGEAIKPPVAAAAVLNGGVGGVGSRTRCLDASQVNAFRISAVIDRLSIHGSSCPAVNEHFEFLNLCLSLARGIDFAIANHDIPSRAKELPSILKQVCQRNNNPELMATIMVLMISVKNACQSGWFSDRDSEELRNLVQEIASCFSGVPNLNTVPSCLPPVISTIMSRFYPRMKMGQIFVFLEAKPGYDAYVTDFQISKNLKPPQGEKIRLLVVQTESFETSSCLINPPKASFLVNGKGVERRTNVSVDTGPQMPTSVSNMLKYGSNLFQAVGEFSGNYIIVIGFMGEVPNPDCTSLQDYVEPDPTTVDFDSELIEGPSRVSLNCPISFTRIRTPVKGHSCKHRQCFDFDNYVDINSKRPSWRCPHCNQHVCFTDLRIDQKMAKILKEVGSNAASIIISSDGSWSAVEEIDVATDKTEDKAPDFEKDESRQDGASGLPKAPEGVVDLTETDAMDIFAPHESEDRKFDPQNRPVPNTNFANQNHGQPEDVSWSGIYLSTFGTAMSNSQMSGLPSVSNFFASPLPDSLGSARNGEFDPFHNNALATSSAMQNDESLSNILPLQTYQFGNPTVTGEYGRLPSLPRNVTRTPIAVQALPAQSQSSIPPQRSRLSPNAVMHSGFSAASQPSTVMPLTSNPTVHSNSFQASPMSSTLLHTYPNMQQNRPLGPIQPTQTNVAVHASMQVSNAYRASNISPRSGQQMPNFSRTPQAMSQMSVQSSPVFMRSQTPVGVPLNRVHPTGGISNQQNAHLIAAANRSVQMAIGTPSYPMNPDGRRMPTVGDQRPSIGISSQPVMQTDTHDPNDQSWRPAGRMRGALTGQAYQDAMNRFITLPGQQAQGPRQMPNVNSPTGNIPAHLQPFMSDRIAQRLASSQPSTGSQPGDGNS